MSDRLHTITIAAAAMRRGAPDATVEEAAKGAVALYRACERAVRAAYATTSIPLVTRDLSDDPSATSPLFDQDDGA